MRFKKIHPILMKILSWLIIRRNTKMRKYVSFTIRTLRSKTFRLRIFDFIQLKTPKLHPWSPRPQAKIKWNSNKWWWKINIKCIQFVRVNFIIMILILILICLLSHMTSFQFGILGSLGWCPSSLTIRKSGTGLGAF